MGAASYTQSIAGCLDGAIGQHGLSDAELARWLDPARAGASPRCRTTTATRPPAAPAHPRGDRRHRRGGGRARQARPGRARHRLLRHRRLEPRRPDAGPARRLAHPRHGRRGADAAARARASTTTSTAVTLEAALGILRSRRHALRRHLQVGRHAGDAGAGAGRAGRGEGGGPGERASPSCSSASPSPRVAGKANGLRTLFEAHGIPLLDHHPGIGGRFSVLHQRRPAAGHGARARCARRARRRPRGGRCADGRRIARAASRRRRARRSPSALARERGIRAQVMMPYSRPARALRAPGSRSCGRRASARAARARRRSPASAPSTSTASCSSSWTARTST